MLTLLPFGPMISQTMPYTQFPSLRNTNAKSSGRSVDAYSAPASRVVGIFMCRRFLGDWPNEYPGKIDGLLGADVGEDDREADVRCVPPGCEMDEPLLPLVPRISSQCTSANGKGGNIRGFVVVSTFLRAVFVVGLSSASNIKTECLFLHDTCGPPTETLRVLTNDEFDLAFDSCKLPVLRILPVLRVLPNDDSGLADSCKLIAK